MTVKIEGSYESKNICRECLIFLKCLQTVYVYSVSLEVWLTLERVEINDSDSEVNLFFVGMQVCPRQGCRIMYKRF